MTQAPQSRTRQDSVVVAASPEAVCDLVRAWFHTGIPRTLAAIKQVAETGAGRA